MDTARTLDTRDRYINTKTAKYQLRNEEGEAALRTMGLFTRAETPGGPLADLHDMQCMWFLTEDGESYARQGKLGLALKRFTAIYNILDVWQEDQFDFHSFSLRKGQIRAYVDMIRWEDHIRDHPFFSRAALSAIKIYIKLHDKPLSNGTNGALEDDGDAQERKKAAKKARKEAQKAEREAAARKNEPNKPAQGADGTAKKVDEDPNGLKLVETAEPLQDAMKFLNPLLEYSSKDIEVQLIGFEVFIRKAKYLLALKCLLAASKLDASHPAVHEQVIKFQQIVETRLDSISPQSAEVIKSEFNLFPASTSLSQFNEDFLSKNKTSPRYILAALRARTILPSPDLVKNEEELLTILDLPSATVEEGREGLALLGSWKSTKLETYRSKAASKWPHATVFTGKAEK